MNRAAFLDRDGVINARPPEGEYVTRWAQMRVLPAVASSIVLLNRAGYRVIVVTNQRCVAKGLISAVALEAIHQRLRTTLATRGAIIDAVYYCPHEKDESCWCRKPAPGMLLRAAHLHNIDIKQSWMIGDSDIDIEAGRSAGCKTARVLNLSEQSDRKCDVTGSSLFHIVRQLLWRGQCAPLPPQDGLAANP